MARNVIEDYKVITGYLPVLKKSVYGGNPGRLMQGETWKTEAEVREYMIRRGFGAKAELERMHFDNSLPRETVNKQVWGVTVTHSGVIKNQYPDVPPIDVKSQPQMPKGFGDIKDTGMMEIPTPAPLVPVGIGVNKVGGGAIRDNKGIMTGASMAVVALIFAIGYLIFARGK